MFSFDSSVYLQIKHKLAIISRRFLFKRTISRRIDLNWNGFNGNIFFMLNFGSRKILKFKLPVGRLSFDAYYTFYCLVMFSFDSSVYLQIKHKQAIISRRFLFKRTTSRRIDLNWNCFNGNIFFRLNFGSRKILNFLIELLFVFRDNFCSAFLIFLAVLA